MQVESKRRNKKLDGISHGKTVRRTTPLKASQPSNAAKVRKDIEPTKEKLRNLADRWKGVNKVRGFLTELWKALGIDMTNNSQQNGGNPSRYAAFQLQDGTTLTVTIRASAHNANASTYIKDGNINGDTNISIVLQNRRKKNTFVPHDDVQLSEYVYVEDRIATVDSPLSQIAMSLVGYLTNGKYVDTTGVAIPHTSPQTNDNNILNCNLNMNKKVIRLTESDLHRIVKESVNRMLNEDEEHMEDGYLNGRTMHGAFTVTNGKCDAVIDYDDHIFVVEKGVRGYHGIKDEQPFTDSQQAEDVCRRVNMMLGTTNFRVEKSIVNKNGVEFVSPSNPNFAKRTYKQNRGNSEPEDALRRQRRKSIQGHLKGEKPNFNGYPPIMPHFTDYGH